MTDYLSVGDLLEAEPLLGGISPEQVLMQVVSDDNSTIKFEVSLFGVFLGNLDVQVDADGNVTGGGFSE